MSEDNDLIISIGARLSDFEKSMSDANSTAAKTFAQIEQRGRQASDKLNASLTSVGANKGLSALSEGFLKAEATAGKLATRIQGIFNQINSSKGLALGNFATGQQATLRGLLGQVQGAGGLKNFAALNGGVIGAGALLAGYGAEQTKQLADMKALADEARTTTGELFGLQNIFSKLGMSSDQTSKLIKTFADRLLDAKANGGALKDALDAAGISFENSDGSLRPTIAVLQDLVTHMRNTKDEAGNAQLATKAFGDELSGSFVSAVKQGGSALQNLQAAAHTAGSAIVDDMSQMASRIMSVLTDLWGYMDRLYSRSKEMLGMNLTGKDQSNVSQWNLDSAGDAIRDLQANGGSKEDLKAAWQKYFDAGRELAKQNPITVLQGGYPTKPLPTPPAKPDDDKPSYGGSTSKNDEKAGETIETLRQQLQLAQSTGNAHAKIAEQIKIENELKKAGVSADSAEGRTIADLVRQTDAATEAEKQRKAALEASKKAADAIGQSLESSVEDLLFSSSKLSDIFKQLAEQIAKMALSSALTGTGSFGGLFGNTGGIFGGVTKALGFAEGGSISGPGTGKSDSILARVSHGEYIINAAAAKDHGPLLAAINAGKLPKFADGGAVGAISTPSLGGLSSSALGGHKVELHSTVNVHSNGGDPAQNQDLARQTAQHVERQVRGIVASELRKQMRPGNLLENVRSR